MPGSYTAYMKNIQAKYGKTPDDFYKLAGEKDFIKQNKITAKHGEMLTWLKEEMELGHVHANMIILYFRLRTKDPQTSQDMKEWAYSTGYKDGL